SFQPVKVNCQTDDTFSSLWRGIFRELKIDAPDRLSPEDIRFQLAGEVSPALIIIDELDRLENDRALTSLADTVKALSDHAVPSTLVLVGVAQSVAELIGEHQSIARALVRVHMPRMSRSELREILEKGCARAGLTAQDAAVDEITLLSRGLPHFAHLLGLHAGTRVVTDDRCEVTSSDVKATLPHAVKNHIVESDYHKAVHSSHGDALYASVLMACALARQDQFGYFTAGAVRDPLEVVASRFIDIPAFARHLSQFLEIDRGSVLQRTGKPRRYLYRFTDPILQTYVVLNGLAQGQISLEQLNTLELDLPLDDEPNEPQPLF
ncbi:MAG TPA: ATP-binding protein, partial [Solirubrobacteraceae bacterium]|nr:ATP-binding protein [Solirubrobacteraceae bacterium]